jgi:hypothetical protein
VQGALDAELTSACRGEPRALVTLDLELPYGYLHSDQVSIIFLPIRGDPVSNAYWSGRYRASSMSAAGRPSKGTLNAALPIDAIEGDSLNITFAGDAWHLDEVSADKALASPPMQVFAGSEILLGHDAALIAPKACTVKVFRPWFGTRRQTHASGSTVYVLPVGTRARANLNREARRGHSTIQTPAVPVPHQLTCSRSKWRAEFV